MREQLLTDRLILRDVSEGDTESLFELDSDPEVMRYVGPRPATDVTWYRERTQRVYLPLQAHPWHGVRVVLDRASDTFLGWVFVRPAVTSPIACEIGWTQSDEVEIGYRYRRSAWGRGVATEAATPLLQIALADPATTAVVAWALAGNTGSLRVLEKLGLQRIEEVMLPGATQPTIKMARAR
jgi:RimJ/RimL family protein N-acetyltransferase